MALQKYRNGKMVGLHIIPTSRGESMQKKIIIISFICFSFVIPLSGCIFNKNIPEQTFPSIPSIGIDSTGQIIIVWTEFPSRGESQEWDFLDFEKNRYPRKYSIIDGYGNIVIDKKILPDFPKMFLPGSIVIDNDDNICFFSLAVYHTLNQSIEFVKYSNTGEKLVNDTIIVPNQQALSLPRVTIDTNDEISLLWQKGYPNDGCLFYLKLDSNGNKLCNEIMITNDSKWYSLSSQIFSDSSNNIHITWQKLGTTEYYITLSNDSNVIRKETPMKNITRILGYPIIEDNSNNLLYLDKNGVVDSDNNIHIFSQKKDNGNIRLNNFIYNKLNNDSSIIIDNRTLYSTDKTMYEPRIEIDCLNNIHIVWKEASNIYYTKLDNNGNTLIDKMLIASGKVEKEESTPAFELLPLILVVVVAAAVMRRRR